MSVAHYVRLKFKRKVPARHTVLGLSVVTEVDTKFC